MDFPVLLAKVTGLEEQWEDPGVSSKMEDGSEISMAKFTKSRGTFKVTYNYMSNADYNTWVNFYRYTCKGISAKFNWVHPVSKITYQVRCVEFTSAPAVMGHGYGPVTFKLREA